jgi:hypothetical protein
MRTKVTIVLPTPELGARLNKLVQQYGLETQSYYVLFPNQNRKKITLENA